MVRIAGILPVFALAMLSLSPPSLAHENKGQPEVRAFQAASPEARLDMMLDALLADSRIVASGAGPMLPGPSWQAGVTLRRTVQPAGIGDIPLYSGLCTVEEIEFGSDVDPRDGALKRPAITIEPRFRIIGAVRELDLLNREDTGCAGVDPDATFFIVRDKRSSAVPEDAMLVAAAVAMLLADAQQRAGSPGLPFEGSVSACTTRDECVGRFRKLDAGQITAVERETGCSEEESRPNVTCERFEVQIPERTDPSGQGGTYHKVELDAHTGPTDLKTMLDRETVLDAVRYSIWNWGV